MKCPKCSDPNLKYSHVISKPTNSKETKAKRKDFSAECKKCGYKQ